MLGNQGGLLGWEKSVIETSHSNWAEHLHICQHAFFRTRVLISHVTHMASLAFNRSHSYNHGSIDDQPESPMGMPIGSDGMSATGSRDPNSAYSTSAPSPTSAQAMLSNRTKRRSDVYGAHESPQFYQAQQYYSLFSMDHSIRHDSTRIPACSCSKTQCRCG